MHYQSFDELIDGMSEEAWRSMRRAVETGRWPDGRRLDDQQRELSLQAVIAWEQRHGIPVEQRTGYVAPAACHDDSQDQQPVTLKPAGENNDAR